MVKPYVKHSTFITTLLKKGEPQTFSIEADEAYVCLLNGQNLIYVERNRETRLREALAPIAGQTNINNGTRLNLIGEWCRVNLLTPPDVNNNLANLGGLSSSNTERVNDDLLGVKEKVVIGFPDSAPNGAQAYVMFELVNYVPSGEVAI